MNRIKWIYVRFVCSTLLLFPVSRNCTAQKLQQKDKPAQVSLQTLLDEMLNRDALAANPGISWSLHHVSSYDRGSVSKDSAGWFANRDWSNYIRKEKNQGREEYVLIDADGPGAITRFWGGGYPDQKGHLRFYMDGQTSPFWETDHWGALIGENRFIDTPLSQRSATPNDLPSGAHPGHNLYAPIPFSHHIKITYDRAPGEADSGFWYNIDYRKYPPGVSVRSFSWPMPAADEQALRQANSKLQHFMDGAPEDTRVPEEKDVDSIYFDLSPGDSKTMDLSGPGSLRRILLSLKAGDMNQAVKSSWLQISFDGKETVNLPAGFFFGCGDQLVPVRTWYNKVDTTGNMCAYWVMPFRQKAAVRLVNKGNERITGSMTVASGGWNKKEGYSSFHADFRKATLSTKAETGEDYPFLSLAGKEGIYAGDILQVTKTKGDWWGEGDEKIYIDDSSFPVDFGTGTEDYYGYAWGHPETFNHIFNAQPLGNANYKDKAGTSVNIRMRNLDAMPFHHAFRFDLEIWKWFDYDIQLARSCFWYEKQ